MQTPDAEKKPLAELCKEPLEVGPAPSTRALEREEMELREVLLLDAAADDGAMSERSPHWLLLGAGVHPLSCVAEGKPWFVGLALGELRLLERRLHQMREASKRSPSTTSPSSSRCCCASARS